MKQALLREDTNLSVYSLFKPGARIGGLRLLTRSKLRSIHYYSPSHILVHIGHNNVAFSRTKNARPGRPLDVMDTILEFIQELDAEFPEAEISFSCLFPRIPHSNFIESLCYGYNALTKRMSRYAHSHGAKTLFVRDLWDVVTPPRGNPIMFELRDGLHLSALGKQTVAKSWLAQLRPIEGELFL